MSWSVSAGGKRDEVLTAIRDQLGNSKRNYLAPAEAERADKILDTIEEFAKASVPEDHVLSVSAWGSESTVAGSDDVARIVSIQGGYNVSVTHVVPIAPVSDAPTAG